MPVFLEQCILSVQKASQELSVEIIVVDNASADNGIEWLSARFPDVHFIRSATNIGFARANNLGLVHAKGRNVLFLNPDTLVSENTLTACTRFLQEHTSCGAVGVRMINGFGNYLPESKRAKPTLINSIFKLTGAAALFPRSALFNHYALGHLATDEQHPVEVLAGAFMMVRKTILDELAGFDTHFFMYGEDVDLSVRIQQLGFSIFYLGDSTIVHYKGQSSRNRTQKQNHLFYTAMRLFVRKHYKAGWLLLPFIFCTQWMAALRKWLFPPVSVLPMLNKAGMAVVVGNTAAYQQAIALLHKRNQVDVLKGYISVNETNALQMGALNELGLVCRQHQIKQVLICIPDLSLQQSMELMQQHEGLFFRFIFTGSESLPFNN